MVLDAGAFIALERRDRVMLDLALRFAHDGTPLVTSAGVVAQVWRDGARQIPLTFVLRRTRVVDLDLATAKSIGRVLGRSRTRDPIDVHIALLARERDWTVLTSDPDDLRRIDPKLRVELI